MQVLSKTKTAYRQKSFLATRPNGQLLKWVGNKYRYANEIVSYFPQHFNTYYEPFIGTGAVLATLEPACGVASDTLKPLIDLWKMVQDNPSLVSQYYADKWNDYQRNRKGTYELVKNDYNRNPNALDLLFISRTCYGGVMRFTRKGTISTPIGPHNPISPETFSTRLYDWRDKIKNTTFEDKDYKAVMRRCNKDDLIYCDPPYKDSQSILYGAQTFDLNELYDEIINAKIRGAKIALSIDGVKKSGIKKIKLDIPKGLFETEVFVECGHSMLRRFQKNGEEMIGEKVKERLLLTW
jgi:DNA adenine methylase